MRLLLTKPNTLENFHYPFGGMPIPEWMCSAPLAVSSEDLLSSHHDFGRVCSYEYICGLGDSYPAFGVLTQGQARDPEGRGFFLDAPGVCQCQGSLAEQAEKIEIAQRLNEAESRVVFDAALGEPLLSARMHRTVSVRTPKDCQPLPLRSPSSSPMRHCCAKGRK